MRNILTILIFFTFAPASYSDCSNGFLFKTNDYLSDYMKSVLINRQAIPVDSASLGEIVSFDNLLIEYETIDSRTVETGKPVNFEALKGARGFAKIRYFLKGDFIDIPMIRSHLNRHYPHFKDGVKINKVNIHVRVIGAFGKTIASRKYELKSGASILHLCMFNKINSHVRKINLEIESYAFSYSYSAIIQFE